MVPRFLNIDFDWKRWNPNDASKYFDALDARERAAASDGTRARAQERSRRRTHTSSSAGGASSSPNTPRTRGYTGSVGSQRTLRTSGADATCSIPSSVTRSARGSLSKSSPREEPRSSGGPVRLSVISVFSGSSVGSYLTAFEGSASSRSHSTHDLDNAERGMRDTSSYGSESTLVGSDFTEEEKRTEQLRGMTYKERCAEKRKLRVRKNICSTVQRRVFLTNMARALANVGAPAHRIIPQLETAAQSLDVKARFFHMPGVFFNAFEDPLTHTWLPTLIVTGMGSGELGKVDQVHHIYRAVVEDRISAVRGTELLREVGARPPEYGRIVRCALAFVLPALVCPLGFGGSFLDMFVAGGGGLLVHVFDLCSSGRRNNRIYHLVAATLMSFVARALSSVNGRIFCYNAIASASIVTILPGFLIFQGALELGARHIIGGAVKMTTALFFAICLGFALETGSDVFLALDPHHRAYIASFTNASGPLRKLVGTFVSADPAQFATLPAQGTFLYTSLTAPRDPADWILGCYRPPTDPWYLRAFPPWTALIIAPLFSFCNAQANGQPWRTRRMLATVLISYAGYVANHVSGLHIMDRGDFVAALGAFVIGLLGNLYEAKCAFSVSAYTAMVPGVQFLVPSGLSQLGGITARRDTVGFDMSMLKVAIGITVGLQLSRAVAAIFGVVRQGGLTL